MKDQLENLVGQMVDRGILFDEAVNEFEKKFIKRVLDRSKGNQSRAARRSEADGNAVADVAVVTAGVGVGTVISPVLSAWRDGQYDGAGCSVAPLY